MVRISEEKISRIKTNILATLYERFPQSLFTAEISKIEVRDEEFIKNIMFELKEANLVIAIKKNPKGDFYSRRIRWRLSNQAYSAYKQHV
jgi:predicted transcriptional regulator